MIFESMRRDGVECDAQSYATMLILYTRSVEYCMCIVCSAVLPHELSWYSLQYSVI